MLETNQNEELVKLLNIPPSNDLDRYTKLIRKNFFVTTLKTRWRYNIDENKLISHFEVIKFIWKKIAVTLKKAINKTCGKNFNIVITLTTPIDKT